jgi:uncharacterized protein (DUF952 family)
LATIYKICAAAEWERAVGAGVFPGSDVDRRDGFIHFSTAEQVAETARRHFTGQRDLVLIAFDTGRLGPALRYEASRGGGLFPHLYGQLDPKAALWVKPLPLSIEGTHSFPDLT